MNTNKELFPEPRQTRDGLTSLVLVPLGILKASLRAGKRHIPARKATNGDAEARKKAISCP